MTNVRLPRYLTVEELAAQEDLPVDYIQAAYQFRLDGKAVMKWFDGPRLLFDQRRQRQAYGQYCLTTTINGREYQDRGYHRPKEEAELLDRAIAAVKRNEEGRIDAMYALWNREGYRSLIEALLAEKGLILKEYQLFQARGTLNTGRGISVSLLYPDQWEKANAIALFEPGSRRIMMIYHGKDEVTDFYSGYGFLQDGLTLWHVGDMALTSIIARMSEN
jgi:hypothetical protein